jgi:thiol:disulfide interchange protein/DsbC/DsbD-like thiol-disulfide interchange protein
MLRYAALAAASLILALAAAIPSAVAAPKVQAELIAAVDAIVPGKPFTVGLRQRITPHWHTYWKNPGDSGEPTRITWTLPEGFTASDIRWPLPEAIPLGPLMNYGYSDALLLPVTITPPAKLDAKRVHLKARAEWLVCEKICIPESADLELTLPVTGSATPTPGAYADLFAETKRNIPVEAPWPVALEQSSAGLALMISAPALNKDRIAGVTFFPDTWGPVAHAAPQKVEWSGNGVRLELKPGDLVGRDLSVLSGVLAVTEKLGDTSVRNGFAIRAVKAETGIASPVNADRMPASANGTPEGAAPGTAINLWQAMLFALLGGLILNLMPCVLPILSLKALTLAGHGGHASHVAARSGFAYLAGVLASFAILAIVLAALRSAGLAFGWGFQFQSPVFVLAMAALFLALALSLSGVFDIGSNAVGIGESLTRKAGLAGSFFTGVLATVAATPCTAPFMGVAVGYALTQPVAEMALVLLTMGLGFALPMLALSLSSPMRALLPKPGPWMETFKQVLAFPLYATVAWLVWVLSLQTGSDGVLSAGITLTAVGLAAWILGCGRERPWLRGAIAAVIAGGAISLTAPWLQVRPPELATMDAVDGAVASQAYSAERVAELRASGRPVFVNLTAAWCITCKVNERVALRSDGFRKAMQDRNVAYLTGDWTNQDDRITRILKTFGRAGVPLYLLYPADTQQNAVVLPQLLTEAIVVRHIAELPRPQAAIR